MHDGMTRASETARRITARLRKRLGRHVIDSTFCALAWSSRLNPLLRPRVHGIRRIRNLVYAPERRPMLCLDAYQPRPGHGLPVVLYIHGGGFRIMSKDSHLLMGLWFARRGYLVFNVDYRLAPQHPFPAAVEDVCDAYAWVVDNAPGLGGDLSRLVVAGESAGANLALGLALAACYRRPEAFARRVWQTEVVPRAVVAACGVLQVSDPERLWRVGYVPIWIRDHLQDVVDGYLPAGGTEHGGARDFADPLVVLERGEAPERPLPPVFAPVGTRDPLVADTRRLQAALARLAVPCVANYYPGEMHAFHAFIWRRQARQCWRDTFAFLDGAIARSGGN